MDQFTIFYDILIEKVFYILQLNQLNRFNYFLASSSFSSFDASLLINKSGNIPIKQPIVIPTTRPCKMINKNYHICCFQ